MPVLWGACPPNQYFETRWGRRRVSVRVGRDEERGGVLVHDDFRLVVVAEQRAVLRLERKGPEAECHPPQKFAGFVLFAGCIPG